MECSWTLARLGVLEGSDEVALEHCRDVLRRWEESEDRHYGLNALGWSAGLFAALGQEEDLNRAVRALASIAAGNGNREALAMLAGAAGRASPARREMRPAPSSTSGRRSRCIARSSFRTIAQSSWSAPPRPPALPASTTRRGSGSRTRASRRAASERDRCRRRPSNDSRRSAAPTREQGRGRTHRRVSCRSSGASQRAGRTARSPTELYLSVRTVDMHVRHSLMRSAAGPHGRGAQGSRARPARTRLESPREPVRRCGRGAARGTRAARRSHAPAGARRVRRPAAARGRGAALRVAIEEDRVSSRSSSARRHRQDHARAHRSRRARNGRSRSSRRSRPARPTSRR